MGKWIRGDLHVHSHICYDASLSVMEILKRCHQYIDFIGISGHSYDVPNYGAEQYKEVLEARKAYPDIPIFHTAEQNFPIQRHVMFITAPDNRELELQQELVGRFHRQSGHEGLEEACAELAYVKEHFGEDRVFMVFNHPNAPDVSLEDFEGLAKENNVFKVIACVDRGERRAKQTWDIGAEWDQLLCKGYQLFVRNGSDFHVHFAEGGHDQLPGEFVQDYVYVEENTYEEIIKAYRTGRFYCTVGNCIVDPVFTCEKDEEKPGHYQVRLEFTANVEMEQVDIISDGKCVRTIFDVPKNFSFQESLPGKGYFRVRGWGKPVDRKYEEGQYNPQFLLNPVFVED